MPPTLPVVVIVGYLDQVERVKQRLISEFVDLATILVPGVLEGNPAWVKERGAKVIILVNDDLAWVEMVLQEYAQQGLGNIPTFVVTNRPRALEGLLAKHPTTLFFDATNQDVVSGFQLGFQLCDRVWETISDQKS